jgi:nitrous oxide reductase accessory protein NosL
MKKIWLILWMAVAVLAGCKKDGNDQPAAVSVKVSVEHMSGVNPLILGTTSTTGPGDPIIINVFK